MNQAVVQPPTTPGSPSLWCHFLTITGGFYVRTDPSPSDPGARTTDGCLAQPRTRISLSRGLGSLHNKQQAVGSGFQRKPSGSRRRACASHSGETPDKGRDLKIVHVDTGDALRGGQEQLLLLARGLEQRGHDQLIVCSEGTPLEVLARREAFRVSTLPPHDPGHAHGTAELRQRLLAERPDVLHAHDGKGQDIAWLASFGMPLRRVSSRHVTFQPQGAGGRLVHRLKYTYTCHGVIAPSDFIKQLLVASGVPATNIEVIPGKIEWPQRLPSAELRSGVRAAWGFGERRFVVGQLGAFTAEKGQDVAVEAAGVLKEEFPDARIVLAGEVSREKLLHIFGRLHGIEDRVRFVGQVENLEEFYAGLDLFIMPSRAEGLGLAALQAMAHGLPVVASRVGGLPEVVAEGESGWLIPPGSPRALADAVIAAASDRVRLARFGANGRERARQFSTDLMLDRTEALYQRLLDSRV